MHRSNVCQALVLTLAFLLLGGKIKAATLRGDFFFGDEPGNLTVHVAQGRITAVGISLPRVFVSGDQSFLIPHAHDLQWRPGPREVSASISPLTISNVVVRYTHITRSRARVVHTANSYYVNSGWETIFLPDDFSAPTVTKQDFTPSQAHFQHTISTHATVAHNSSRGKILTLEFKNYNLTAMRVALAFEQAKGGTWNVKIKVTRSVLNIDVFEFRKYATTASPPWPRGDRSRDFRRITRGPLSGTRSPPRFHRARAICSALKPAAGAATSYSCARSMPLMPGSSVLIVASSPRSRNARSGWLA